MPSLDRIHAVQQEAVEHHASFNAAMGQILADARAYCTQQRGRALPAPDGLGQLPAAGVQITEQLRGELAGDTRVTIITPADVPWQNLANYLEDQRAWGASSLDHLDLNLGDDEKAASQASGHGAPGEPSSSPTGDPYSIIPWIDFLADIIAYGLVFWGLVVAAQAVGIFTFFTGLALLGLTGILQHFIIDPLRGAVKMIFGAIVKILADLVEFVATWIRGILEYFQGDLFRAVLQILEVAAFMWIWEFAQRIPAIANILNTIMRGIQTVTGWVNSLFDGITKSLEGFRKDTEARIDSVFDASTALGKQLTSTVNLVVDRLIGGLEQRVAQLRFDLLAHVDLATQALHARITIFGQRLQLLPDEVRRYIAFYGATHPYQALAAELSASVGLNPNALGEVGPPIGPWDVIDELRADLLLAARGGEVGPEAAAKEFIQDLEAMRAGSPPDLGDWPANPFPPPKPEEIPALDPSSGVVP